MKTLLLLLLLTLGTPESAEMTEVMPCPFIKGGNAGGGAFLTQYHRSFRGL